MDHGGPERSWSTTQHHGPAGTPGPLLDHLDCTWSTSCNHTPEIEVQGGSRWTRGTTGTMELGGRPGALWSHFYILLMIYEEDVDFNFVKIHLLSHFRDYIWRFGNIQMYSTESWETNHKRIVEEGYWWSNKGDASHQILRTYARLDSFKIHEMNIQAVLRRLIEQELRDKQHKRQVGSLTRQPQDFTPNIETISQFNHTLKKFTRPFT